MPIAYLNIGTNIGDKRGNLSLAIFQLESALGEKGRKSDIIESEPWGFQSVNSFLNIGLAIEINCTPEELLQKIHEIEKSMGSASHRNADGSYADRLIDIDIMAIEGVTRNDDKLKLPHPLIAEREFFLEPLKQLTENWEKYIK